MLSPSGFTDLISKVGLVQCPINGRKMQNMCKIASKTHHNNVETFCDQNEDNSNERAAVATVAMQQTKMMA